jgi:hypothetical protein
MDVAREVPPKVLRQGRNRLGIGQIDLESEEAEDMAQALVLTFCLYHYREGDRTLLEKHLDEHPPDAGSPEAALRDALPSYRYALVEPLGPGDDEGLPCIDLLRGEGLTLMDESLADTAQTRTVLGAGLLRPGDDFAMPTGAVLPATADAAEQIEAKLTKKLDGPLDEVDFGALSPHRQTDVAAVIVRECLRDGALQRISGKQAA